MRGIICLGKKQKLSNPNNNDRDSLVFYCFVVSLLDLLKHFITDEIRVGLWIMAMAPFLLL